MSNPLYDADRAIAAALQSAALQQNQLLHAIGTTFNWWGGSGVIYFAAALWLGGRALRRWKTSLVGLRGAEGIALVSAIGSIVKVFVGRTRPFVTPGEPWHWSFMHGLTDARYFSMPSGHTYTSFAFAAAIGVASARWKSATRTAMIAGAYTAALLVAFARVYTNQHWFSDVFVGALLGCATGALLARWHERHPRTAFDHVMLGAHSTTISA
jgi:membrane-associated phospholipid phosphatase